MRIDYLTVEGCKIRYCDTGGDGPAVILTHGIGGSLENWSAQYDSFAGRYRLIGLDLPGHGLSDLGDQPYEPLKFAHFLWQFVDALGLGRVALAGYSMGGGVSLLATVQQQARVSHLILVDAATLGRQAPLIFRLMTLPVIGEILTKPSNAAIDNQIKAVFADPSIISADTRHAMLAQAQRPGAQKAFLSTLRLMTDFGGQRPAVIARSLAALKTINIPMLIVHGRQDRLIPLEHSKNANRLLPQARFEIIENCGHCPPLERPAEFNRLLADCLG